MRILAIDPGSVESGYVIMDGYKPIEFGKIRNTDLISKIFNMDIDSEKRPEAMAVEMIASYGKPVGKDVFETCVWIGRFWQERILAVEKRLIPVDKIKRDDHQREESVKHPVWRLAQLIVYFIYRNGLVTRGKHDVFKPLPGWEKIRRRVGGGLDQTPDAILIFNMHSRSKYDRLVDAALWRVSFDAKSWKLARLRAIDGGHEFVAGGSSLRGRHAAVDQFVSDAW